MFSDVALVTGVSLKRDVSVKFRYGLDFSLLIQLTARSAFAVKICWDFAVGGLLFAKASGDVSDRWTRKSP